MDRSGGVARGDVAAIAGASAGTVIEWYDFFLYGSLASFITRHFFSGVNETTGYIFALLAFAAGFAVRPIGAVIFGRLGDLWGRKNTFLVSMLVMGLSTFLVGLLPSYAQVGMAAPGLLIGLRLVQGLALGGEYGGAMIYVAEHAPPGRRGAYVSWIQLTATAAMALSLLVILACRKSLGDATFAAWGWRIPFLASLVLLGVSLWIRLRLGESPVFQRMIAEGKGSKAPLQETFGRWPNVRLMLLALTGLTAGSAVVWYAGQFYALFFLEKVLRVDGALADTLLVIGLLLGCPFFWVFGRLSDRIGRKPIILTGLVLAAVSLVPLFETLTVAANPALARASAAAPVAVIADPKGCALQFDPLGKARFDSPCDVAKSDLAKAGISYANVTAAAGAPVSIAIGAVHLDAPDGRNLPAPASARQRSAFETALAAALVRAGYPLQARSDRVDAPRVVGVLFLLMLLVTMVSTPAAAMLVELFPARIRYTAMSFPYHLGNGWFGGFLPASAFAIVAATGNIYSGLWYPIVVILVTAAVGALLLPETRLRDIDG
jgi:MFS family permease